MSTAIVKPYRIEVYNIIDIIILSAFIQILFSAAGLPFGIFNKTVEGFQIIMLGLMVPLVYTAILAVYKILPKTWTTFIMEHTILHLFCRQSYLQRDVGDFANVNSII